MLVYASTFPEWLTAIGGVGAFIATGVLAYLAWRQMAKLDEQVQATREQVDVMRQGSADDLAAVREQIDASVEQGNAIREAARAQRQPVVFAHALSVKLGPDDDYSIDRNEVAFPYFLANEGTGIALNITHGVEIDGVDHEYGFGMQTRVLRPGDSLPIRDPTTGGLVRRTALSVVRRRQQLSDRWETVPRNYWANFANVFGERFETRNPTSPNIAATFNRV